MALAVSLVAATAFFVDASAARMTERALAAVAIDMQAGLSAPLASPLQLTEARGWGPHAGRAGQTTTITLAVLNASPRMMTNLVHGPTGAGASLKLPARFGEAGRKAGA